MGCVVFSRRRRTGAPLLAAALVAYDKLAGVSVGYGPTAGGRVIRIIGAGFMGATGVTFGGTAGTVFSVVSDTLIEVTAPAKAAGAYDVVVQHPNGNATIAGGYTYTAAPSISGASYSLTTDTQNGGGLVNVTSATGIKEGSTLTLGGVAVGFIYVSATAFSFHIPTIAIASTGAKDLIITQLDGQTGTKSAAVTYTKGSDIAEFTDGATMDAAASIGGVYRLVGATTGAEIALLQCVTTGPVTYRLKGNANWYQATGTEFTGVFTWAAVGAGGAITWGATPGSRTAGGLKVAGGGTIELQGLALMSNWTGINTSILYIIAHDTAPATGRGVMSVWTIPGVNTTIIGGGFGYSSTVIRCSGVSGQSRDTPTMSLGGSNIVVAPGAEWVVMGMKYINQTNVTGAGVTYTGTAGNAVAGTSAAAPAAGAQSRLALWKGGDTDFLLLQTNASGVDAT